jgi:type III secretion protein SpaR/YscT/HrcT
MIEIQKVLSLLMPNILLLDALLFFMLIFTRWLVMSLTIPFFGAQLLPSLVRISLASFMSVVSFFMLINKEELFFDTGIFFILLLFFKEALLGFILGFLASLIFYIYALIGEFIDFARAASMSKMLVPELKHHSSSMGVFLFQLALILYVTLGLHRDTIKNLYLSFRYFPVLSFSSKFLHMGFLKLTIEILDTLFELALRLSLPIIFICFLIDISFGLMNRVAPQVNAYFLSLPAKIIGGLMIFFFLFPFLIDDFYEHHQNLARYLYLFLRP